MYEVRVSAEVAKLQRGTRRRAGRTFSRAWTRLDEVPDEVRADPHLEVREIDVGPRALVDFNYNELKRAAAQLGLSTSGKKADLLERIKTAPDDGTLNLTDADLRPERFGEK